MSIPTPTDISDFDQIIAKGELDKVECWGWIERSLIFNSATVCTPDLVKVLIYYPRSYSTSSALFKSDFSESEYFLQLLFALVFFVMNNWFTFNSQLPNSARINFFFKSSELIFKPFQSVNVLFFLLFFFELSSLGLLF